MAHISRKEKRINVIQAGLIIGITIDQKMRKIPAPSILPASNRASGMLSSIYCFIKKAPIAEGIAGMMYTQ